MTYGFPLHMTQEQWKAVLALDEESENRTDEETGELLAIVYASCTVRRFADVFLVHTDFNRFDYEDGETDMCAACITALFSYQKKGGAIVEEESEE